MVRSALVLELGSFMSNLVVHPVRRVSPDPAARPTEGLLALPETFGRALWLGLETGHNFGAHNAMPQSPPAG